MFRIRRLFVMRARMRPGSRRLRRRAQRRPTLEGEGSRTCLKPNATAEIGGGKTKKILLLDILLQSVTGSQPAARGGGRR